MFLGRGGEMKGTPVKISLRMVEGRSSRKEEESTTARVQRWAKSVLVRGAKR